MTSRERVLTALAHREPDRPPRLLYGEVIGYVPAIERLLKEKCAPRSARDYFRMDISGVRPHPSRLSLDRFGPWYGKTGAQALASGQVDEWGVWWRGGSFYHFAHIESPLKDVEDFDRLKEWPWPDLDQPYRYEGVAERVQALQRQGFAVTGCASSIFEQSWYIRGMESLMADMLTAPEQADYFFDRTAHFQQVMAVTFAQAGVDILMTGDDVACQRGLLMSKEVWRRFLKPRLAASIRAAKRVNPELKFFYHCDGNVEELIPDLIEIGVDILNPIQPECMDPARIKRLYGDRLSFWGTVSLQRTMTRGTPDEVRAEVRERIRTVGKGGGLILAPAHVLSPETPWENIVAFFEAADGQS